MRRGEMSSCCGCRGCRNRRLWLIMNRCNNLWVPQSTCRVSSKSLQQPKCCLWPFLLLLIFVARPSRQVSFFLFNSISIQFQLQFQWIAIIQTIKLYICNFVVDTIHCSHFNSTHLSLMLCLVGLALICAHFGVAVVSCASNCRQRGRK